MKRFKKASLAGLTAPVLALAGCYVVPVVDPQGNVQYGTLPAAARRHADRRRRGYPAPFWRPSRRY